MLSVSVNGVYTSVKLPHNPVSIIVSLNLFCKIFKLFRLRFACRPNKCVYSLVGLQAAHTAQSKNQQTEDWRQTVYIVHVETRNRQIVMDPSRLTIPSSPLSPSVAPTLFHSKLETHLFHKTFPPWILSHPPDCLHGIGTAQRLCFSISVIFLVRHVHVCKLINYQLITR